MMDDGLSCRFQQMSVVALTLPKQPNPRSAYYVGHGDTGIAQ